MKKQYSILRLILISILTFILGIILMAFFLELPQNLVFKESVSNSDCEIELEECRKNLSETIDLSIRLGNEKNDLIVKLRSLEGEID